MADGGELFEYEMIVVQRRFRAQRPDIPYNELEPGLMCM